MKSDNHAKPHSDGKNKQSKATGFATSRLNLCVPFAFSSKWYHCSYVSWGQACAQTAWTNCDFMLFGFILNKYCRIEMEFTSGRTCFINGISSILTCKVNKAGYRIHNICTAWMIHDHSDWSNFEIFNQVKPQGNVCNLKFIFTKIWVLRLCWSVISEIQVFWILNLNLRSEIVKWRWRLTKRWILMMKRGQKKKVRGNRGELQQNQSLSEDDFEFKIAFVDAD